jgi:hypothetical protein
MSRGEGRLQRSIRGQLAVSDSFLLLELIRRELGHEPDHRERVPWYDAAKRLERAGKCRTVLESHLDRRGREQKQMVVCRLDYAADLSPDSASEVEESEPEAGRKVAPQDLGRDYIDGSAEEWAAASALAYAFADPGNWAASHGRLPRAVPDADYHQEMSDDMYELIADWDARDDEADEFGPSNTLKESE